MVRDTVVIVQRAVSDNSEIYKLLTWALGTILTVGGVIRMFSSLMLRQSLPSIIDGIKDSQDGRYVLKTDLGGTAEHKAKSEIARWWSETQRERIEPIERDVAEIKHDHKHLAEAMRKSAEESGAMAKALTTLDRRMIKVLTILRPDEPIE